MFDVESREWEKDVRYYQSCMEGISEFSKGTNIFCLIHKMDLVPEDQRDIVCIILQGQIVYNMMHFVWKIFQDREMCLKKLSQPLDCRCFRTSIWDETLYKAWSTIVYSLIPNVHDLEVHLRAFADIIGADEVLLFERATFLVICYCERKKHKDRHVSYLIFLSHFLWF